MVKFLKRLERDTRGATAVEYGLILALVFFAMVGAVQTFGAQAVSVWSNVATSVTKVVGV